MDSAIVAVRKSVVARIEGLRSSLSIQEFTLTGSYAQWDLDLSKTEAAELDECDKLRVDVVTHGSLQQLAMSSRGTVSYSIPVDIMIRRRFGQDKQNDDTGKIEVSEIDKLMFLFEQIHLMFAQQRLADSQLTVWDGEGGGTKPLWTPNIEHLKQWRQFSALLRVFFRVDMKLVS